jgi:hypothetical protein
MIAATPTRFVAPFAILDGTVCVQAQAPTLTIAISEDALAAPPTLVSARFSDDLGALELAFSGEVDVNDELLASLAPAISTLVRVVPTADASVSGDVCSVAFGVDATFASTRASFGAAGPWKAYMTSSTTAKVVLPSTNVVAPESYKIAVLPGMLKPRNSMALAAVTGVFVTVAAPANPVVPQPYLGEAASISSCKPVTVAASVKGTGGRALAAVAWSILSAVDDSNVDQRSSGLLATLTASLAAASTAKSTALTIGASDIPAGWYVRVHLSVTNFLGQAGTAAKLLAKQQEEGPELVPTQPSVAIKSSDALAMGVRATAPSCPGVSLTAAERAMTFYWFDVTDGSPIDPFSATYAALFRATPLDQSALSFAMPEASSGMALASKERSAKLPAFALPGGNTFTFRVFAVRDAKPTSYSYVDITVQVTVPPPTAVIAGAASDTVSISDALIVDGSGSYDGAKLATAANTGYRWACEPDTSANAAVGVTVAAGCGFDLASFTSSALRFPARYSGFVVGATYVFTLTYKVDSRSATASKKVRVADARPLPASGWLLESVTSDGRAYVKLGGSARMQAAVELPATAIAAPTYTWSQSQGPAIARSLFTAAASTALPLGAAGATFAVDASALVPSSAYEFCADINAGTVLGSGRACVAFLTAEVPALGALTVVGNPTLSAFAPVSVKLAGVSAQTVSITAVEFRYAAFATNALAVAAAAAAAGYATPAGTLFDSRSTSDLAFSSSLLPEGELAVYATALTPLGSVTLASTVTMGATSKTAAELLATTQTQAADGDATTTGALLSGTIGLFNKQNARRLLAASAGGARALAVQTDDATVASLIALLNTSLTQSVLTGSPSVASIDQLVDNLASAVDTMLVGRTSAALPAAWVQSLDAILAAALPAYQAVAGYQALSAAQVGRLFAISDALSGNAAFSLHNADALAATRALMVTASWNSAFTTAVQAQTRAGVGRTGLLVSSTAALVSGSSVSASDTTPLSLPAVTLSDVAATTAAGATVSGASKLVLQILQGHEAAVAPAAPAGLVASSIASVTVFGADDKAQGALALTPSGAGSSIAQLAFTHLANTAVPDGQRLTAKFYNATRGSWSRAGTSLAVSAAGVPVVTTSHFSTFALVTEAIPTLKLTAAAPGRRLADATLITAITLAEAASSAQHSYLLNVALASAPEADVTVAVDLPAGVCVSAATGTYVQTAAGGVQYCAGAGAVCSSGTCVELLASAAPTTLTFTSSNWASAQIVTVTAVADSVVDQSWSSTATLALTSSSVDTTYSGLAASITVTITDDDTRGVTLAPAFPATLAESDTAARTYAAVLTSKPLADVVYALEIAAGSVDYGVLGSSDTSLSLTFTTDTWSTPQTFTVSVKEDAIVNPATPAHQLVLTVSLASSTDLVYQAMSLDPLAVTISDNDAAGVIITPAVPGLPAISEAGGSYAFTVALTSEPSSGTVSIVIDRGDSLPASATYVVSINGVQLPAGQTPSASFAQGSTTWSTGVPVVITMTNDGVKTGDYNASFVLSLAGGAPAEYVAYMTPAVEATLSARVAFTVQDINNPALLLTGAATSIAVGGSASTFAAALRSPPTQDVVVTLTVGNAASSAEGYGDAILIDAAAATLTLTFTPAAYGEQQFVLAAPASSVAFPRAAYSLTMSVDASADAAYAALAPVSSALTLTGAALPGIALSAAGSLVKGGSAANLSVTLTNTPVNTTVVALSGPARGPGVPALVFTPSVLYFSAGNASEAVQVTVSAPTDDYAVSGRSAVVLANVTAGDASAVARGTSAALTVPIAEPAAVSVTTSSVTFVTSGSSAPSNSGTLTFGVDAVLALAFSAKPTAALRVTITSSPAGRLALPGGASSVLIQPEDWAAAQLRVVWVAAENGAASRAAVSVRVDFSATIDAPGAAVAGDLFLGWTNGTATVAVTSDAMVTPSGTPAATGTPTVTATGTVTATDTGTRTSTASQTATASATASQTPSRSLSPSASAASAAAVTAKLQVSNVPLSLATDAGFRANLEAAMKTSLTGASNAAGTADEARPTVLSIVNAATGAVLWRRDDAATILGNFPQAARRLQGSGSVVVQFVIIVGSNAGATAVYAALSGAASGQAVANAFTTALQILDYATFASASAVVKDTPSYGVAASPTSNPSWLPGPKAAGSTVAAAIGGSVGGAVVLVLLVAGAVWYYKRHARNVRAAQMHGLAASGDGFVAPGGAWGASAVDDAEFDRFAVPAGGFGRAPQRDANVISVLPAPQTGGLYDGGSASAGAVFPAAGSNGSAAPATGRTGFTAGASDVSAQVDVDAASFDSAPVPGSPAGARFRSPSAAAATAVGGVGGDVWSSAFSGGPAVAEPAKAGLDGGLAAGKESGGTTSRAPSVPRASPAHNAEVDLLGLGGHASAVSSASENAEPAVANVGVPADLFAPAAPAPARSAPASRRSSLVAPTAVASAGWEGFGAGIAPAPEQARSRNGSGAGQA